jgi:hypothetical protein
MKKLKFFFYVGLIYLKAKNKVRKLFLKKIFRDLDFRNKYVYIHLIPYPHICIGNNFGQFLTKLFKSNEHEFIDKYLEIYFPQVANLIHEANETNNIDEFINNVIEIV